MSEMVEALRSTADLKGSLRYTFLLAGRSVLRGVAVGMAWEATIAVIPLLAQRAIHGGIMPGNWRRLPLWLALNLVAGLLTAVFTAMRHRAATQAGALARLDAALTVLGATIPALAMAAVSWQGGLRVVSGDLTVCVLLLAFGTWMVRLYSRSAGLVSRFTYSLRASVSAGRVNELMTVHPEIRDPARPAWTRPAHSSWRCRTGTTPSSANGA